MKVIATSDLGRLASLQNRAAETREQLNRASTEMTTGENTSRYEATQGNLTRIFAIDRSLDRNEAFSQAINLTVVRVDTMQSTLGLILSPLESLSANLTSTATMNDLGSSLLHAKAARFAFKDTVAALNAQAGGLSLFAGTATDGSAIAPADDILAQLDALAQGASTASDAIAAIDDYFRKEPDPAGAFYSDGYTGSTDDTAGVDVGEGRRLDYGLRADNDKFVAVLRAHALAAVVDGGAFANDKESQLEMLRASGRAMIEAKNGVLELQTGVGVSQSILEDAKAGRLAERDTLELARNKVMGVDQTESAALYQALGAQLEAIYTVTARLSKLSYAQFLR